MRKLVVLTFVSLDGVMQAPGEPWEDPSGGFKFGGWAAPYFDEFMGKVMIEQMEVPFDLLLGRKTYDIFASYWPKQDEAASRIAKWLNHSRKYVVSATPRQLEWQNSHLVTGDAAREIKALKQQAGPMLQVHGSGNLIQMLLKYDLVDELWLKTFPLTLGNGKRLFGDGAMPAAFRLLESKVSPSGVIVANYARAGNVKTGSFSD